MPTQGIGSKKLSLLVKTILEKQRRLITSPPPTTTITTPARRTTRSLIKARNSRTLESNNRPLDPFQRMTCPTS
jgi:hypothetical protein